MTLVGNPLTAARIQRCELPATKEYRLRLEAAAPLDPRLDILNNWGDEVLATHRPLLSPLSPAIDTGSCPGSTGDQRRYGDAGAGQRRVDLAAVPNGFASDGCDIGAHERAGAPGADLELFLDGFEGGHTLPWSSEAL